MKLGRWPRLAIGTLVVIAASCSDSTGHPGHSSDDSPQVLVADTPVAPFGEPDVAFGGPQGDIPQFVAECPFSHASSADPIVEPGAVDGGHRHLFFGAIGLDENSTFESMSAGETTCNQQLDRSAYWIPALFDHGVEQVPDKVTAYYRPGPGVDPTTVRPYPDGLKIVAGGGHDRRRPPATIAAWTCGVSPRNELEPPDCPPDSGLRMIVTFPDCWDGTSTDSADHRSHMRYSMGGRCPTSHPVSVPQLTTTFAFLITGPGHSLALASGGLDTLHADFFNAWEPAKLATEVASCLHRSVVCAVTSSR